jgi:hypothetical protein
VVIAKPFRKGVKNHLLGEPALRHCDSPVPSGPLTAPLTEDTRPVTLRPIGLVLRERLT